MKKLLVAAMFAASCLAVPALPAAAAPIDSAEVEDCIILPILKAECWQLGADTAEAAAASLTLAASDAAEATNWPFYTCERAPEGSGYLLTCAR